MLHESGSVKKGHISTPIGLLSNWAHFSPDTFFLHLQRGWNVNVLGGHDITKKSSDRSLVNRSST